MIQYEKKCQIVTECGSSLVDISSHAAEVPRATDSQFAKEHVRHHRFLSPWQALVQTQQMMNKSESPLEHTLGSEAADEL